jgi:hypothetical protein
MEWNDKAVTPLLADLLEANAGELTRNLTLYYNIEDIYYTAYADFTTPHPTRRRDYVLEDGLDRILTPALVPKETSDLALGKCR